MYKRRITHNIIVWLLISKTIIIGWSAKFIEMEIKYDIKKSILMSEAGGSLKKI